MSENTAPKRVMLVVNPKAGNVMTKTSVDELSEMFTALSCETAIYFTSPEYSAEYLVKEHAEEVDIVVCSGGDGTVNDVIKAEMQLEKRVPIGYIPAGTTNDLARSLGLPKNPKKAIRNIVEEAPLPYDVGSFNDDYFAYIAAFGAFTEVSYSTSRKAKNIFGRTAYIFSAMKALHKPKSFHVQADIDGGKYEGDYCFFAVTNSTSVAGVFRYEGDKVHFTDGKFEVLMIKSPDSLKTAIGVVLSMFNKSYKHRNIQFFHASDLTINCDVPLDWTLDGEHAHTEGTVHIANNCRAVEIIRRSRHKKEES